MFLIPGPNTKNFYWHFQKDVEINFSKKKNKIN